MADPAPSPAPDVEEQTLLAVSEGHHGKLLMAILSNLPVMVAVAWALRAPGRGAALVAWIGAGALVSLARLGSWWAYRRDRPTRGAAARRWLLGSTLGTLATSLVWGAGLLAFLPGAGAPARLFVATLMAGMVAGSAGTLADHLPAFLTFGALAGLPVVAVLGASDDPLERLLGPFGLLYLVAITLVAWMSGRRLRAALRHRFEGERLVRELTATQARLSTLNADLEARVQDRGEQLAGAERALSQAALLASVGGLAAGVAHEINNPLSSVLTNVRFVEAALAEGAPGDAAACREALADAHAAATRVREIVRSLSAVAGADADAQPLDLRDLLDACAAVAGSELRPRATLRRELGQVPPIHAAAPGLAQVFVQLLLQAARSLPEGDPARCEVRLRAHHDRVRDAVVVELEAHGPARAAVPAGAAAAPAPAAGTFGLRLAQDVVARLGGELADRSGPGGAAFRVLLPVRPPGP